MFFKVTSWGDMAETKQEEESSQTHALLNTNNSHSCENITNSESKDDFFMPSSHETSDSIRAGDDQNPLDYIECLTSSTAPGLKKCQNNSPKKSPEAKKKGRKERRNSPDVETANDTEISKVKSGKKETDEAETETSHETSTSGGM